MSISGDIREMCSALLTLRGMAGMIIARFLIVFGIVVSIVLCKALYNLWLHPLAKYPGPVLSRATNLVYWYYWLTGRLPHYIESVHQKYGTKVRIGPNNLSFIDPAAWKDLHGHKSEGKTLRVIKDPGFYVNSPSHEEHSLLHELDDSKHGKLRKMFSLGFSDRALKAQENLILTHVDKLVDNIYRDAAKGKKIDMVKFYNCVTFDIIGELAFGESLGLLENSELNAWVTSILYGLEDAAFYALVFEYPFLKYFVDLLLSKEDKNGAAENAKYSADRVRKRMAKGNVTDKPDFWTLVLSQHEKGVLNIGQMNANADLFMQAGSETTATMLSGLTYNFLMDPDKMKMATEEVRRSFKSEEELTIEGIQGLEYLGACFDESMRIYPSAPLGPPRVVVSPGSVAGEYLPVGTKISIAALCANHSPAHFKDPLKFAPERWIETSPEYHKYANDHRDVFKPFSTGPRNCIGKNLALHEMRLIACKMLWHFDFELCEESRGTWFEQKCFWALWSKPPLWVKATAIRPREAK